MKDAKTLLIIKNVDIELAKKIQILINDYNEWKAEQNAAKRKKSNNEAAA